ncbi:HEPN domain-containing protein, partial [Candidatus Poribacteria bacterium]|nr:HEPN domain-containing protein [Candidatus Poribacteria bacterium]
MISKDDLRKIARAKLKDAEVLYKNRRYDGAVYLCGYTIETVLKARICRTLKWEGFPSTRSEFQSYQSFRTHDLVVLLTLSG